MYITRYHKLLRILLLVFTIVTVFDSGIINPVTQQMSNETFSYVATIGAGMYASVPPNEINTLTAQIAEQQRVLDAREAALREREIAAREYENNTADYSTYIFSAILFLIIVLLFVNYVMDWTRMRQLQQLQYEEKII